MDLMVDVAMAAVTVEDVVVTAVAAVAGSWTAGMMSLGMDGGILDVCSRVF